MKTFRSTTWNDFAASAHGKKVPLEELDEFRAEEKKLIAKLTRTWSASWKLRTFPAAAPAATGSLRFTPSLML